MKLIGVTGTNGKTTITYLVEKIFSAQYKVGVIGTINHHFGKKIIKAKNTTPGFIEMQKILQDMSIAGVNLVAMEVSSHGLHQNRVRGLNFSSAIFTNLTPEHLDYHGNMKNYFLSKAKLFKGLKKDSFAIINIDDKWGRDLLKLTKAKIITYGFDKGDFFASDVKMNLDGISFNANFGKLRFNLSSSLIGRHNVYNILAAAACGISQNIPVESIINGIKKLKLVCGRLEAIEVGQSFKVFVDYAHTPDALENVILTLDKSKKKRLILVFGCGGDRDRIKRPKMGRIASRLCDYCVITSDNPRSEDPQRIAGDIAKGISTDNFIIELDRFKAIKKALSLAKKDDIVLVCGKGHETAQIFKDKTIEFCDQKVIECLLSKKF